LVTSQRPTNDRSPLLDANVIREKSLRSYDVADGNGRKVSAERSASFGLKIARTSASSATSQNIGANDKEAIRIDRTPWAYELFPPARIVGFVVPRCVRVSRNGMANQDCIRRIVVQLAPRFKTARDLRQAAS